MTILATWLIDTALFKSLAPGRSQSLRVWLETHAAPVFLSAASLVEIEAAIAQASSSQTQKGAALCNWLDGLLSGFGDIFHPGSGCCARAAVWCLPIRLS